MHIKLMTHPLWAENSPNQGVCSAKWIINERIWNWAGMGLSKEFGGEMEEKGKFRM
jgi:hypothetical protein